MGGYHHHARVGAHLAQTGERGEPVDAGHAHVEEHHVERLGLEGVERRGAVLDGDDLVPGLAQPFLEHPAQAVLVVGDQDPGIHWTRLGPFVISRWE